MHVARVLGQAPEPRRRLVAAPDRALRQRLQKDLDALATLVARPGADDLDGLVERLGVAPRADLAERADAQLRVAVALQAGQKEAAAELTGLVEVQHRLRPPPVA